MGAILLVGCDRERAFACEEDIHEHPFGVNPLDRTGVRRTGV
jgi:hypothetical protein